MSFLLECILSKFSWPGWIWSFMDCLGCRTKWSERRWQAGGWSRLPAVRRAARSLLVAREDRGASPSYQRPWPPAPGKPTKQFDLSCGATQNERDVCKILRCKKPPWQSFRGCVKLSGGGQLVGRHNTAGATEGAASTCDNQTTGDAHTGCTSTPGGRSNQCKISFWMR